VLKSWSRPFFRQVIFGPHIIASVQNPLEMIDFLSLSLSLFLFTLLIRRRRIRGWKERELDEQLIKAHKTWFTTQSNCLCQPGISCSLAAAAAAAAAETAFLSPDSKAPLNYTRRAKKVYGSTDSSLKRLQSSLNLAFLFGFFWTKENRINAKL